MTISHFPALFDKYNAAGAPFLHAQYHDWNINKPLRGLRILHHVPVVENSLLKIAALIAGGADVTVTNPNFMKASSVALQHLKSAGVTFVETLGQLQHQQFDIHLDCGAELYQALPNPTLGTIELTGTGDHYFRQHLPAVPVISVDRTYTKQLETIFGAAISAKQALQGLLKSDVEQLSWLVFGFGKIGRGLAYCQRDKRDKMTVVDINEEARIKADSLGINYIDANNHQALKAQLQNTQVVITATGQPNILANYPKQWFANKVLANMGIADEFGDQYALNEVLFAKQPINFYLDDPTPIEYIDPEMYLHNQVILDLIQNKYTNGIHDVNPIIDHAIISQWCDYHKIQHTDIKKWFIQFTN